MTHLAAVIVQEAKLNCETAFRLFLCMTETYRMDLLYGPEMHDVNLRFFQVRPRPHVPRDWLWTRL